MSLLSSPWWFSSLSFLFTSVTPNFSASFLYPFPITLGLPVMSRPLWFYPSVSLTQCVWREWSSLAVLENEASTCTGQPTLWCQLLSTGQREAGRRREGRSMCQTNMTDKEGGWHSETGILPSEGTALGKALRVAICYHTDAGKTGLPCPLSSFCSCFVDVSGSKKIHSKPGVQKPLPLQLRTPSLG